jgi:hypothetical protein
MESNVRSFLPGLASSDIIQLVNNIFRFQIELILSKLSLHFN